MAQVARARMGILGRENCIVKPLPMAQVTRARTRNLNLEQYTRKAIDGQSLEKASRVRIFHV